MKLQKIVFTMLSIYGVSVYATNDMNKPLLGLQPTDRQLLVPGKQVQKLVGRQLTAQTENDLLQRVNDAKTGEDFEAIKKDAKDSYDQQQANLLQQQPVMLDKFSDDLIKYYNSPGYQQFTQALSTEETISDEKAVAKELDNAPSDEKIASKLKTMDAQLKQQKSYQDYLDYLAAKNLKIPQVDDIVANDKEYYYYLMRREKDGLADAKPLASAIEKEFADWQDTQPEWQQYKSIRDAISEKEKSLGITELGTFVDQEEKELASKHIDLDKETVIILARDDTDNADIEKVQKKHPSILIIKASTFPTLNIENHIMISQPPMEGLMEESIGPKTFEVIKSKLKEKGVVFF